MERVFWLRDCPVGVAEVACPITGSVSVLVEGVVKAVTGLWQRDLPLAGSGQEVAADVDNVRGEARGIFGGQGAHPLPSAVRFPASTASMTSPAEASPYKPSGASPQPYTWMEHAPPKLTQDRIDALVRKFSENYPGEILSSDAMPSIRLLRVPWQYRLSAKQYQEIHEAKAYKPLRSEMQILAQAMVDDTPEISLENRTLARDRFSVAKRSSVTPSPCATQHTSQFSNSSTPESLSSP